MTMLASVSKMIRKKPRIRRCAIVQLEAVHEEIIPSIVRALNSLDIVPDVFINQRCKFLRGDIFNELPDLELNLNYISVEGRQDWITLSDRLKSSKLDCVILSTYQREGIAAWAAGLDLPIIGFVHNAHMFLNAPQCLKSFQQNKTQLLTLAPHVCAYLNQRTSFELIDRTGVLESIYWGEKLPSQSSPESTDNSLNVAIPGGVSFKSRSFQLLIDVLSEPKAWNRPLKFHVLGGGADRKTLEQLIKERNLSDFMYCAPLGENDRVMYDDYISGLQNSHILHPLAPLAFGPYREYKITSAIPTAVGFGLPVILDRWTARVYRAPSIETDVDLAASIQMLSNLTDELLLRARDSIVEYRKDMLARNTFELARILSNI